MVQRLVPRGGGAPGNPEGGGGNPDQFRVQQPLEQQLVSKRGPAENALLNVMQGQQNPDAKAAAIAGVPPPEIARGAEQKLGLKSYGASLASVDHPQENQDAIAHDPDNRFAVLCDGMGGQIKGAEASRAARNYLGKALETISSNNPEAVKQQMATLLQEVSRRVGVEAQGGGTTATAVKIIKDKDAIIGHVGDSRAYIVRGGQVRQITEDDNLLSMSAASLGADDPKRLEIKGSRTKIDEVVTQQDLDTLTPAERSAYEQRNAISQSLDGSVVSPHIYHISLEDGDRIVLTSDGEYDNLTATERNNILLHTPPADLPKALTEAAMARSVSPHFRAKHDDISAVVMEVGKPKVEAKSQHPPTQTESPVSGKRVNLREYAAAHGLTPAASTGSQPESGNPLQNPISQMQELLQPRNLGGYGEVFVRRTIIQAAQPDQISNLTPDQSRQLIQLYAQYNDKSREFNRVWGDNREITLEKFDEAMKALYQKAGIQFPQKPWWVSTLSQ